MKTGLVKFRARFFRADLRTVNPFKKFFAELRNSCTPADKGTKARDDERIHSHPTPTNPIESNPGDSLIISEDGIRFQVLPSSFRQITEVPEYCFADLSSDDMVIDIGANVGAFCLRAARVARHVTAVEPLTTDILRENIRLNQARVTVIEGALGDGAEQEICWDSRSSRVPTFTFREIVNLSGGCTFLKCDCEGAEWLIDPEELTGIRRIEMELHLPPISGQPNMALLDYLDRHYEYSIERKPVHDALGVMGILHAERR